MKAYWIFVFFVVALLLIVGCNENKKATTTTASDGVKTKTTITTDEGEKVVVEGSSTGSGWCQAGSEWKATATESTTKMVIVGLETSGKYAGLCHVVYDINAGTQTTRVDMYFNREGTSGYQVMNINGQKIESQWSK